MELHFLTHGYFTIVSFTTIYPAMTRSTAFIFALQRPKPSSNVMAFLFTPHGTPSQTPK
jgi:hypothetical protein